jgi:hypothetical protein
MAQTNISIIVEAIDQATKVLDSVKGSMKGVDGTSANLTKTITDNKEGFRNL